MYSNSFEREVIESLAEIKTILKHTSEAVKDHEDRLRALESGKTSNKKTAAAAGGIAGFVVALAEAIRYFWTR